MPAPSAPNLSSNLAPPPFGFLGSLPSTPHLRVAPMRPRTVHILLCIRHTPVATWYNTRRHLRDKHWLADTRNDHSAACIPASSSPKYQHVGTTQQTTRSLLTSGKLASAHLVEVAPRPHRALVSQHAVDVWAALACDRFGVSGLLSRSPDDVILTSVDRRDRKSTRLNSSHSGESRMPSSA